MDKHYDVYDNKNNRVVSDFELLKEAELWIIEQDNPDDYEIIPVEVQECSSPMNLFLSHGMLTRNKR